MNKCINTFSTVNFPSFLAEAKKTRLGSRNNTIAPHKAPEYLIIFPIDGIRIAKRMAIIITAPLTTYICLYPTC